MNKLRTAYTERCFKAGKPWRACRFICRRMRRMISRNNISRAITQSRDYSLPVTFTPQRRIYQAVQQHS